MCKIVFKSTLIWDVSDKLCNSKPFARLAVLSRIRQTGSVSSLVGSSMDTSSVSY